MERFKERFLIVLIAAMVICAFLAAVTGKEYPKKASGNSSAQMDELLKYTGWRIMQDDGSLIDAEFPTQTQLNRSQNVRILNLLPKTLESGTYLAFESFSTYVTVKVDEETIYRNLIC